MMDFVPDAQEDLARIRKIINSEVPLNDKIAREAFENLKKKIKKRIILMKPDYNKIMKLSWKKHQHRSCIGRMYMAHPSEDEQYYLHLLLTKVKGARSFEELKMVNDIMCATFKESAQCRGFLENDNEH